MLSISTYMTGSSRRTSIRWRLMGLIAAILVPFTLATAFLGWCYADAESRVIEAQRFDQVNNLNFLMEGELGNIKAVLVALAAFPELQTGDFESFRTRAASTITDRVAVLAVLDESGQQLFSSAVPFGLPLPKSTNMSAFTEVWQGKTMVSDVLVGTVVKRPIIAVAAPVFVDGRVRYVLSAVIYPETLVRFFAAAGVNNQWAAAVVDRQGRFVTRTLRPARKAAKPTPSSDRASTRASTYANVRRNGSPSTCTGTETTDVQPVTADRM